MYFKSKKDKWMAIVLWAIVISGAHSPIQGPGDQCSDYAAVMRYFALVLVPHGV